MEDPDVEWKIEEYSSSSDSLEEGGKSNVKWILENGLRMGKKAVVAGFVISSAPLVIPSIVVVSALGIAVSVPFGLVFASYACTQKLLNKLLPLSASSPMLEYDIMFEDVGAECVSMEDEEKEKMDDVREEIERRIKLVKNENELPQEDDEFVKEIRKDEEERLAAGDERFEEKGYEEDVDVKIEGEGATREAEVVREKSIDEEPLPKVKRVIAVFGGEKRRGTDIGKPGHLVVVARGVGGESLKKQRVIEDKEDENLKKESVGLLEKIRDEGRAGRAASTKKKKEKKKKGKHGVEKTEVQERDDRGEADVLKELESSAERRDKHLDILAMEVEKHSNIVAGGATMDYRTSTHGKNAAENVHSIVEEKQKPAERSVVVMQQRGTQGHLDTDMSEDFIPKKEESVNDRNGVTRRTADDLTDQKFSADLYKGNERAEEYSLTEAVDVIEGLVKSSGHVDEISQLDSSLSSIKDSVIGDDRIWRQIDALRTIVGYRATPHRSCIEEVKALYMFTGVEPPSSFEDATPDLSELNVKLRFLMSVVGVK